MKVATATKTEEKKVSFAIKAPNAKQVLLAGSFNNWSKTNTPLKKISKDGTWSKDLTLKSGRYEYKFIVDGNWIIDPNNSNKAASSLGTENSIIEI